MKTLRKLRKTIFRKLCYMAHLLKTFPKFWKPFFTNQITNFYDKIMLVENEKVVSKNEKIAYLFNTSLMTLLKD